MRSTLINERVLGGRGSLAGNVPDAESKFKVGLARINQELWLVLSLFVIAGLFNWLVASHRMILGLYTLPTIFSAYVYGRRHAVLTASASIFMVLILLWKNTGLSAGSAPFAMNYDQWSELLTWAGLLLITAYAMGTLYDRKEHHLGELRQTYFGLLTILQQFISNDKYTHNHSYRVALYASSIAARMGFEQDRIDDVRAAALLHDVGKLETSRDLLHKAASLTPEEMAEMRKHVQKGVALLEPVGGSLRRVLPIILAHHDKFDGSGYGPSKGDQIPIEARVLAVADAYDTLTSDRPYRRAVTPFEARQIIVSSAGSNFDPAVVDAFVTAFEHGEIEIPEALVV
ncbi:MAG TPA: HD-GYP domain-containing protein [Candidatus Acidoferrum sp.]|nr:HD-GYP domain-containing protein [Candidatus Acidoferrum sp.]